LQEYSEALVSAFEKRSLFYDRDAILSAFQRLRIGSLTLLKHTLLKGRVKIGQPVIQKNNSAVKFLRNRRLLYEYFFGK
jgi:hypothetical protein